MTNALTDLMTDTRPADPLVADVMQRLLMVWADFDSRLNQVPILDKLQRGKFRGEDYQLLLLNLRQQVVEGGGWISRAASSITREWLDLRSMFLRHAITEHRDFTMLEQHYVSLGGQLADIRQYPKNVGSEAFSAYMYYQASQPNPFHLLGAMFVIEGLGQHKARQWGTKIKQQLDLTDDQVQFFLYHGDNDEDHMQQFTQALRSGFLTPAVADQLVMTARVVARLYRLQLEELGTPMAAGVTLK